LSDRTIETLIDSVDSQFHQWRRFSTLHIWLIVEGLLLALMFVGTESYTDLAVRIAILAAVLAVILGSLQIISDSIVSWVADANYLAIKNNLGIKKDEQDLRLLALAIMKAVHPAIKLRDAYELDHDFFESKRLIERLYGQKPAL
jgi:hypothetical protein